jgi:cardiolipin synthase (CMP-forming)
MKLLNKFSSKDLVKIPNILCYIRFLLIPVFVLLYVRADTRGDYLRAAYVIFISGATDFFDGFIARRFDMITELGKLIDPLADKLTQAALIFVLVIKIKGMFLFMILFVVMQLFLLVAGIVMLKKGTKLNGARWFGKISTTVFYAVMLVLVSLPTLNLGISNLLMLICGGFLLLSFLMYIKEYLNLYSRMKASKE